MESGHVLRTQSKLEITFKLIIWKCDGNQQNWEVREAHNNSILSTKH